MAEMSTMEIDSGLMDSASLSGKSMTTNWSKCVICQVDSEECLICPVSSSRVDLGPGTGCVTFERDVTGYDDIKELPETTNLSRFNNGNGIFSTMMSNEAKWHKSCRKKFNSTNLQHLAKRKNKEIQSKTDLM